MSHNISDRQHARRAAQVERQTAEYQREQAVEAIERFNIRLLGGLPLLEVPLLRAARLSGRLWMHVLCPGCKTVVAIDLTVIKRPDDIALTAIAAKLKCQRCRGEAAPPRIIRMSESH